MEKFKLYSEYGYTNLITERGSIVIDHEFSGGEGFGEFKGLSFQQLYAVIGEYSRKQGNTYIKEPEQSNFFEPTPTKITGIILFILILFVISL